MSPQQDWVFGDVEDRKQRLSPSRVAPRRARRAVGRFFLFLAWLVTFTVGATCAAVLAAGLLRDGTFTDARVPLDLSRRGEWRRYHFHPSLPGQYVLYLTSDDV